MDKQWFVFYTKSRQEKKTKDILIKYGFEVFLPIQKIIKQWSDRKKKVDTPLFSSYLFVRIAAHEIPVVLGFPGIAWVVKFNDGPATLRAEEISLIERFIATGLQIETGQIEPETLKAGDKAEVLDGPLKGVRGILSENPGRLTFHVLLEGIEQMMRVQIPGYLLRKL